MNPENSLSPASLVGIAIATAVAAVTLFAAEAIEGGDVAGSAIAAAPVTPPSAVPRVADGVAEKVVSPSKQPIVIVEGLAGPLPRQAVGVSRQLGAGGVIDASIEALGDGKGWAVRAGTKRIGSLRQSGSELMLDVPSSGDALRQIEHLVLEILPAADRPPLVVPLGRPASSLLQVRVIGEPDRRPAGGAVRKTTASIPREGRLSLFDDPAVNAKIVLIAEAYPDLVETFQFVGGLASRSRTVTRSGRDWPAFTFTTANGAGVELRRLSTSPLAYRWNGLVFPLLYGKFNEQYADTSVFDERVLAEIPRRLKIDLERLGNSLSFDDKLRYDRLTDAAKRDKLSMDEAEAFPIESLRGRPVRLTLAKPGTAGGFVVVDSLGSSIPDASPATSSERARP